MTISQKRAWTLVEHLRGLGIEPEAPNHPVWQSLGHMVGSEFIKAKAINPTLLRGVPELALPAAPFVITCYKWAAKEQMDIETFKGSVNRDVRVQRAMQDYVLERGKHGISNTVGDTIQTLATLNPLPKAFAQSLHAMFNAQNSSPVLRGWLGPLTGLLPEFSTWRELRKAVTDNYNIQSSDVQAAGDNNDIHWTANHRMDLILAAWLCEDLTYIAMPLYNHLPNVCMDAPDAVTAVLWTVATAYVEVNPDNVETEMLSQWMQGYPEYLSFFQDNKAVVQALVGNDMLDCAKAMHQTWVQKQQGLALEANSIDGLLEP